MYVRERERGLKGLLGPLGQDRLDFEAFGRMSRWEWRGVGGVGTRRHIIQTAMGTHSSMCNTLGNEKMVGRNFLSSRLSLSLILTISPLTDVKKSIRYFGQNWRWLERTNEQMNKWTNEQMNTAPLEQMNKRTNEQMNTAPLERTNKWTNEQMNTAPLEQMNKWTLLHLNKWTNEHCSAWKSTNLGPIL